MIVQSVMSKKRAARRVQIIRNVAAERDRGNAKSAKPQELF